MQDVDKTTTQTGNSLQQHAYEFIQRRIADGSLAAGTLISEQTLARELGISRTPVREAIGRLQTEGLLESLPKRGTLVRRLDRNDLIELYEMREAMESFAASRAAGRIESAEVEQLHSICDDMSRMVDELRDSDNTVLDSEQMRRHLALDMALHMTIIRAAGNSRIFKVVSDSRLLTRVLWAPRQEHDLTVLTEAHDHHTRIVSHIEAHEAEAAGKLMAEHIRVSLQRALDHADRDRQRRTMSADYLPPLNSLGDTTAD